MRGQRPPLFLARAVYRKRRLRDAARLLPLMGVFLLLLPLLWARSATPAAGAGQDWPYIFGIWALLIVLAAALAPGLAASDADGAQDEAGKDR